MTTASADPTSRAVPIAEPEIPTPPPAIELTATEPTEQAAELADAILGPEEDRLAGWLRAYDALGIPVLDTDGAPVGTTGDDPVGSPFWRVWYASVLSRAETGFALTDFARFFSQPGQEPIDGAQLGTALLDDLRAAVESDDAQVRLLGELVAELVRRGPESVEIAEPHVTAGEVFISGGTAELLTWVAIRNLVVAEAQAQIAVSTTPASAVAELAPIEPALLAAARGSPAQAAVPSAAHGRKCSELFGNEEVTYWINWFFNKAVGGFQLPGMVEAFKGMIEGLQSDLGVSATQIERTQKITAAVGVVTSILTLALQIGALRLDGYMEPQPLERTRYARDNGKEATIYLSLSSDPGQLPSADETWACVTTFVLNAFGVTLGLPPEGKIVGAEIELAPGQGIGDGAEDYVLFRDANYRRQTTNRHGEIQVVMIGKAQRRDVPQDAIEHIREFSINVSGQPTAVTATTLFDIFYAGLGFGVSPSASSLVAGVVEIAKTIKWDLGEHFFPVKDWLNDEWVFHMTLTGAGPENELDVVWQGNFSPGSDGEITGAGTISGGFVSYVCSVPTDLSGGTEVTEGRFPVRVDAEFEMQGEVEVVGEPPDQERFFVLNPVGLEDTIGEPVFDTACFETAFGGGALGFLMLEPTALFGPIRIEAQDGATLTQALPGEAGAGSSVLDVRIELADDGG